MFSELLVLPLFYNITKLQKLPIVLLALSFVWEVEPHFGA